MPEAGLMPAAAAEPDTLRQHLRVATAAFHQAGIENGGNDARQLLAWVLECTAAQILSEPDRVLTQQQTDRFADCVARRLCREPVSRTKGERDFHGHSFAISPATLDPRADSETVVEAALEFAARERWQRSPVRIVDVGTGSGCLLLSLLAELPNAHGVGTDISAGALRVAQENARRLKLEHRAQWINGDVLDGVGGPFDLLVCNPPYVRSGDIAGLAPEVRCFDPVAALDGGQDGLDIFRRLTAAIGSVVPNGWVVLEVGHDQADAVAALLRKEMSGLRSEDVIFRLDVAGKRRCVAVRTRS